MIWHMKNPEAIKKIIKESFANTVKGQGIGLREANALDDRADKEAQAAARAKDIEEHWWDLVEEWDNQLGTALSFTDKEGFKFLLPAAMWAALDGSSTADAVQFHLCSISRRPSSTPRPHHGHPEYTEYLRTLHPKDWVSYFDFTPAQVHATATFLQWVDNDSERDCERELELRRQSHQRKLQYARPGDYTLRWEDVLNNYKEERRVLKEWFDLGNVFTE